MLSQVRAYFTLDEKFLLSELVEPFNDHINTSTILIRNKLEASKCMESNDRKVYASHIIKTPRTLRQLKICCNARTLQCPTQSGIKV